MKKVRLFSLAAIVALSSFIAPQTASAYKYHVTLPDGSHEVFLMPIIVQRQSTISVSTIMKAY